MWTSFLAGTGESESRQGRWVHVWGRGPQEGLKDRDRGHMGLPCQATSPMSCSNPVYYGLSYCRLPT